MFDIIIAAVAIVLIIAAILFKRKCDRLEDKWRCEDDASNVVRIDEDDE